MTYPNEAEKALVRENLRARFTAQLDSMVERHLAFTPHGGVPNHHFAAASAECIDSFRAGRFIACIQPPVHLGLLRGQPAEAERHRQQEDLSPALRRAVDGQEAAR